MKNCKYLNLTILSVCFFIVSCSRQPLNIPRIPEKNPKTESFIFFNITINTNSAFNFNLPALTKSMLDSGTISVYYRSVLVVEDRWYPLPYYPTYSGNEAFLAVVSLESGQVTIKNYGLKAKPLNYKFEISGFN